MSVDTLLNRLDKVKSLGKSRWNARCPAHDDRGPSLSIRELDDGRVLVHCFAGCEVLSVLSAVQLDFQDLFPKHEIQHARPERRPFPATDILRAIAHESLVVAIAASLLVSGQPFTEEHHARLNLAITRIEEALAAGGVRHG